jgi:hypothetical protein
LLSFSCFDYSIKTENKGKCELCTMWYDRKSIKYKVPNHRILALRKQWGYNQTGTRYSSASYLYGNSKLCVFCAQLFSNSTKTFTVRLFCFIPYITDKISLRLPMSTKPGASLLCTPPLCPARTLHRDARPIRVVRWTHTSRTSPSNSLTRSDPRPDERRIPGGRLI